MSILIDQRGHVLTKESNVNELLAPVQTGRFILSDSAEAFIENELTEDNVKQLFEFIPEDMRHLCQTKKLIPTKASIFKQQEESNSQSRSDVSQIPHINAGDEIHFFFDGSYLIYFNLNNQHYSLVVQKGDWLFIPADVEHWIKATDDQYLIIVSYHSEPFDRFHEKVKYTKTKSQAFL